MPKADGRTLVPSGGNLAAGEFAWERFSLDGGPAGRTVDLVLSNDAGNYWRLGALIMAPGNG
jgi:cytochrome c